MRGCSRCQKLKDEDAYYASQKAVCKECVKARVRSNRKENLAYYRSYDRMRYRENDNRKEAAHQSASGEAGKAAKQRYIERTRAESPEKAKARNAVANSLRAGKIVRADKCYFCEEISGLQAHHPDYARPLDVFWLCPSCHGKLHALNGDFLRPIEAA